MLTAKDVKPCFSGFLRMTVFTRGIAKIVNEIKYIQCNKCGKKESNWSYICQIEYSTGYESYALPDGMMYRFDLCEGCLADLMDIFKVPPTESSYT